jgi:hypothetical protein
MSPDGRGPRACDAPGHPPFAPRRDRRPPDALLSPSPVLSAAGVKPLMPLSGSPGGRVHVCVCVPIVAVCPMRAALLGVACLRVFVWPLSVSLVGVGVWYAVEVRPAGYRERCAGACRCVYYCLIVLLLEVHVRASRLALALSVHGRLLCGHAQPHEDGAARWVRPRVGHRPGSMACALLRPSTAYGFT